MSTDLRLVSILSNTERLLENIEILLDQIVTRNNALTERMDELEQKLKLHQSNEPWHKTDHD